MPVSSEGDERSFDLFNICLTLMIEGIGGYLNSSLEGVPCLYALLTVSWRVGCPFTVILNVGGDEVVGL